MDGDIKSPAKNGWRHTQQIVSLWNSEPSCSLRGKIKWQVLRPIHPNFLPPGFALEPRVSVQWGGRREHPSLPLGPQTSLNQLQIKLCQNKPGCPEWWSKEGLGIYFLDCSWHLNVSWESMSPQRGRSRTEADHEANYGRGYMEDSLRRPKHQWDPHGGQVHHKSYVKQISVAYASRTIHTQLERGCDRRPISPHPHSCLNEILGSSHPGAISERGKGEAWKMG